MQDDSADTPSSISLAQPRSTSASRTPVTPDVRLYHRAVVVAQETHGEKWVQRGVRRMCNACAGGAACVRRSAEQGESDQSPHPPIFPAGSLRGMVRQLSIDQFENESRRVSMGPDSVSKAQLSPMFEKPPNEPCVSKVRKSGCDALILRAPHCARFLRRATQVRRTHADRTPTFSQTIIKELLHPRTWKPPENRSFFLDAEQINELCDVAERIFRDEPSVLQLQGAGLLGGGGERVRRTARCTLRRTLPCAVLRAHM